MYVQIYTLSAIYESTCFFKSLNKHFHKVFAMTKLSNPVLIFENSCELVGIQKSVVLFLKLDSVHKD